jgi:hypothetical protein
MFGLLTVLVAGLWSYWRNQPRVAVVPVVEIATPAGPGPDLTPDPLVRPPAPAPTRPAAAQAGLEERWGFRIAGLSLLNDGLTMKLDYEATMPAKFWPLANGQTPAYLLELATGTRFPLIVPPEEGQFPPHSRRHSGAVAQHRVGGFPGSPNHLPAGQTISIIVPNREGLIQRGSQVVMVVGETQSDKLTVE